MVPGRSRAPSIEGGSVPRCWGRGECRAHDLAADGRPAVDFFYLVEMAGCLCRWVEVYGKRDDILNP